ncbi:MULTISPECIES: hypothetical protein [Bradyrhizobium]|uniref:hypothetical protein n=1 Tax=Bradyrhizobium TaxID=374 RepID=UPI00040634BA|nr:MULTISPECIES: hypothetical protein [Bradyrhizobium]QOG21545.1 hypothetical protein FOM02_33840 [Bradyrhizobium sp. SEMIA]UFW54112.1 hypothetical protein BaraCB756_13810 [Bradyrhizobium arachidis]
MSHRSNQTRSIRSAVAGFLMIGLLSPAHATDRSTSLDGLPDLPSRVAERLASAEPTSHLPWLAPVGHHQPSRADAPQSDALSALEREQQQRDRMLDRKLIICRGC